MDKKKVAAIIAFVLVILSLMAVKLVLNKKKINEKNKPVTENKVAVSVTAEKVKSLPVKATLVKTGALLPGKDVDISSTSQGKIEEMKFELGTKVSEGQVIAKIDSKLKELALQQAEMTVAKLEKDYSRFQTLLEGNAVTEVNFNEIKFNYENAKNQAEQLRKQISDASIKAPVTGTVVRKNFDEGEFVNFGVPLGTIVDVSKLKVQVMVSEKEVYSVFEKQPVKVTSDVFPGTVFNGEVNYVSPKGDDTHNYLVEITLKNDWKGSLKAGTFVYAEFSGEAGIEVLQIPRNALVESLKNPYVYVVRDNKAKKLNIKVGREFNENIEVLEGLTPGELVVTSGQINLSDDAEVNIVSQE